MKEKENESERKEKDDSKREQVRNVSTNQLLQYLLEKRHFRMIEKGKVEDEIQPQVLK
ncbi:hypothetical protein J1N35_011452, partial [Gossypium stocksii]